ncbi:sulfotransferase [Stella sp.]|uniref:sulfotransferase n=1 Tax=Stella sp. TaxID=2912054 RepID=UPI0035AE71B0
MVANYLPADYPPDAPPRFRLYGIGLGKTGTISLCGMFGGHFRSTHEPDWRRLIRLALHPDGSRAGDFFFSAPLQALVAGWQWEMNSSTLNYHLVPLIRRLQPEAKFVLTVREPVSWVASMCRHESTRPRSTHWDWWELRRFRFRPDLYRHGRADAALERAGLFSLEGYLRWYARQNRKAMEMLPADTLLVVAVDRLSHPDEIARLAAFAGVAPDRLARERAHLHVSDTPFDLFDLVDRRTVEAAAEAICGDVWQALRRRAGLAP